LTNKNFQKGASGKSSREAPFLAGTPAYHLIAVAVPKTKVFLKTPKKE
jgi:hypothetical protein